MSENNDYRLAAERGDEPLLPSERLWGFWEFAYANSALAIATWAFLIGGAVGPFVGPKEGIAVIVIGNIIGVPALEEEIDALVTGIAGAAGRPTGPHDARLRGVELNHLPQEPATFLPDLPNLATDWTENQGR